MTAIDLNRMARPARRDPKAGPFLAAHGKSGKALNWFFADKERMFWVLQAAGWLGFLFLHFFSFASLVGGGQPFAAFGYSIASSLVGFVTTSMVMRPIFRFSRRQGPAALLLIALSSTILMAYAMTLAKAQALKIFFTEDWAGWVQGRAMSLGTDNFLLIMLPDVPANLFLLLSWAGFYFGINYYLTLRNETERALVAARLADQAQLKMLRYQLNPHFLFNTLNAISTLVLEKEGKAANDMLTRLSAFLRYSLDSDALQKTTLAEELRALQLYLDIEKTRFCDRLEVVLDVDADVRDALVPSLILQPAVENAIKFAIGRMESGGRIAIIAKKEADMLRLEVVDNGPEAPRDPSRLLDAPGAGVGLVNMRDRLAHLYGTRQSFHLSANQPSGLRVSMKLPYETRDHV